MHWLLDPQWSHCQAPLSSSPDPDCPQGTPWGPASSRSWTCVAPITLFISGKATSGRCRSLPPSGHYEYRVMLYILSNSPSIFQGFMNEVWMGSRWTRGRSKPSQPQSVKEHQWFLGFANFYRRFIQNFILFSAPSLPCSGRNPSLCPWNSEAQAAYKKLQEAFCAAPVLSHPEPPTPIHSGSGYLHHWRGSSAARLHPCTYFSRKLSPVERNYDIGNR